VEYWELSCNGVAEYALSDAVDGICTSMLRVTLILSCLAMDLRSTQWQHYTVTLYTLCVASLNDSSFVEDSIKVSRIVTHVLGRSGPVVH